MPLTKVRVVHFSTIATRFFNVNWLGGPIIAVPQLRLRWHGRQTQDGGSDDASPKRSDRSEGTGKYTLRDQGCGDCGDIEVGRIKRVLAPDSVEETRSRILLFRRCGPCRARAVCGSSRKHRIGEQSLGESSA